jgi:hypothetical protein
MSPSSSGIIWSRARGDHSLASARERCQALRDVDAVAKDVALHQDDFGRFDTDPQQQMLLRGQAVITAMARMVDGEGGGQGIGDLFELHQEAVAHPLDQPAVAGR